MPRPLFDSPYIFGIHDPGGEHLMAEAGKRGWIVFTVEVGCNPADTGGFDFTPWADQEYGILCRLNNGYGSTGTIPAPARYGDFARRVARFVAASRGCKLWIVGNEMNHGQEWPGGQLITPAQYAECFRLCRAAIHALPGHADDGVIIGAVAPWNEQTKYPSNPTGDWGCYFADILAALGAGGLDGIALHTYTHGADPGLVTSDAKMDAPFTDRHFQFGAYRDFLEAVPPALRALPVYITETDQDSPWHDWNDGWVQAAYAEIDRWNRAGGQQVRCLALYRWLPYDQWSIQDKGNVQADFRDALRNDYRWREGAQTPQPSQPSPQPPQPALGEGDAFRAADMVRLRAAPGVAGDFLQFVAAGTEGQVIGPPSVLDGMNWQRVRVVGVEGWMAEALPDGTLLLEKIAAQQAPEPCGGLLLAGDWLNVREGPGTDESVLGMFRPRASVFAGGETVERDGILWRRVSGIGHSGAVIGGYAAERAMDGTPLLVPAPKLPGTDFPDPQGGRSLAAPFDGCWGVSQLWGENPGVYHRFSYESVPLAGHNGIDFLTPTGTVLRAVEWGEVHEAGYDPGGFGHYVLLHHPWGESIYAHLSSVGVIMGQEVRRGEVIGWSGNTGNSSGPHLHFAIRINPYRRGDGWGGYSDPLPYLPAGSFVLPAYVQGW